MSTLLFRAPTPPTGVGVNGGPGPFPLVRQFVKIRPARGGNPFHPPMGDGVFVDFKMVCDFVGADFLDYVDSVLVHFFVRVKDFLYFCAV
jgi:hypothetical protein